MNDSLVVSCSAKRLTSRLLDRSLLFALFCLATLPSRLAAADFFLHPFLEKHEQDKVVRIQPEFSYYRAEVDFDQDAKRLAPANLNSYSRIQGEVELLFGATHWLTFFGRVNWSFVLLDHLNRGGTSYGPGDQTLGANARIFQGTPGIDGRAPGLSMQLQVDLPTYSNVAAEAKQLPYLGDGSFDFTAGFFGETSIPRSESQSVVLRAGIGYTFRTASFSMALPWSFSVSYEPKISGLFFWLGSSGIISLRTDTTQVVPGTTTHSLGTGGIFMTNAINPTLVTPELRIGYQVSPKVAPYLEGRYSIIGVNAPQGFDVLGGVKFRLGGAPLATARGASRRLENKTESFREILLEAQVLRANDRLNQIRINKGAADGVEKGQIFDVYQKRDQEIVGDAVARGTVARVGSSESILVIDEYYKEVMIDEGFVARRLSSP
jgi:hypothetical protein